MPMHFVHGATRLRGFTCFPSRQCRKYWPVSWGWWGPRRQAGSLYPFPVDGGTNRTPVSDYSMLNDDICLLGYDRLSRSLSICFALSYLQ